MHKVLSSALSGAAALAFSATLIAPASAAVIVPRPGLARIQMPATAARVNPYAKSKYTFQTINNSADPTFNQLLGINNSGTICGYFGSGVSGHPNKGYCVTPPYTQSNFVNENFPGSAQTQVVALDNIGNTAGFWVDNYGNNFGFIAWNNVFTSYTDTHTGKGTVNQILGLNDAGIAAGFYVDGKGLSHGYTLNQNTGKFTEIIPPGGNNAVAAGMNNKGDVTGFLTASSGNVVGFLMHKKTFTLFEYPGSTTTMPFGLNSRDQIVGAYLDASGGSHGFVLSHPMTQSKWVSVDDPMGVGTTLINGTNDLGQIVGFYTDATGNTDGFLGNPK